MKTIQKNVFKRFKFWAPIVTGAVTSGAFAAKYLFDFEVPDMVLNWMIVAGLNVLGVILGVDWSENDDKVDK